MLIDTQGARVLFFQDELKDEITSEYFDGAYWQRNNAIIGSAFGRGITWFFKINNDEFVLRHYHRGGLIGKLIKDGYCYTGLKNTRAYQEFLVTQQLVDKNLPVPQPIAGQVIKHGLFYRADLITQKIAGANDLVAVLKDRALNQVDYQQIGAMIRRFHDVNLWHADLNTHNIILDGDGKWWLIDFDRCKFKPAADAWKQANLARLKRSFVKEKNKDTAFKWQTTDWDLLLAGYQN
ncbi:3-deoxy-D-manno-octulosonic acid kinase [Moritella sp. Urea-trap-13]|uniref:3-deoxy-D-manno-octulosonic acid kinase n=1 Tax=Moritella sp. Urea-trap-13 TaxID=2058327 RepID=UPI000C340D94|nr:3-deoxy-D-manno-octulosonic acid kinase [Moritella sp. Urea-trap-13]PKH07532.1 3-deoxy-D-manno-octulosonic acid kinase [Moritella sp. Urea-trap-13]